MKKFVLTQAGQRPANKFAGKGGAKFAGLNRRAVYLIRLAIDAARRLKSRQEGGLTAECPPSRTPHRNGIRCPRRWTLSRSGAQALLPRFQSLSIKGRRSVYLFGALMLAALALSRPAAAQIRGGNRGGQNAARGANANGGVLPLPEGVTRIIGIDAHGLILVESEDPATPGQKSYSVLRVQHIYGGGIVALFGGINIPTAQFVSPAGAGGTGGGNGTGGATGGRRGSVIGAGAGGQSGGFGGGGLGGGGLGGGAGIGGLLNLLDAPLSFAAP